MKKIISLFMATIMLLSCINVSAFANQESSEGISTDVEDILLSESALSVESNDISIEFNVTDKWTGGFNGSITVENMSNDVIENWQIQFEFPHEIINIWNAQIISYENGIYNIKNAGGNNAVNIPVGESVSFGFTGTYEDEIFEPENVKLITGKSTADTESYTIDYELLSDWGSGYSAQITITNNTNEDMESWHLKFVFDREIESIWNAVITEHTDNNYYISNAGYNSVIYANNSITFGFNGTNGSLENEPQDYELIISSSDNYENADEEDVVDEITNGDYYLTEIGYVKGDSADSVTQDLILPTAGYYSGSTITWESSNPSLVTNEGKVTRPTNISQYVTLTATFIDDEGLAVEKDYVVKVIKEFIEIPLEQADIDLLEKLNNGMPFIWIDKDTSKIRYINGAYTDYQVESSQEAIYSLNALKDLYGIKNPADEYVYLDYTNLDVVKRYRLQQVYNGLPVYDSNLIISTDSNGNITSINGCYDDIPSDLSVIPENNISIINSVINAPSDNSNYELMIYEHNDNFVLCWKVYNSNDGNTYFVADDSLKIIGSTTNKSASAVSILDGENGKEFDVSVEIRPRFDSLYAEQYQLKGNEFNVKRYVEVDKNSEYISGSNKSFIYNNRIYASNNKFYGTASATSSTGENVSINLAEVQYGKYIINKELFDINNNVMYLIADSENYENVNIAEYSEKDTQAFQETVSAYINVGKALDYLKACGMSSVMDILGFSTYSKSRPLYIVTYKDYLTLSNGGAFSNDEKILKLGKDKETGYVSAEKYDIVVHELTHGLLYNKAKMDSKTLYKKTIHEAYGDIMACLANNNWCFMEDFDGVSNTSPRDIGNIKNGKYINFKTSLKDLYNNSTVEEYLKKHNDTDKGENYYFSTILSYAAYKMNTGTCGVAIDSETLSKIWYNSISKIYNKKADFYEVAISVLTSAQELGCSDAQLNTIKNAFEEAGINELPLKTVSGNVLDKNNNFISDYNLYLSSNDNYNIYITNTGYIMNIYDSSNNIFNMNCTASGYTDFNKEITLNNTLFSTLKQDIMLNTLNAVQTANVNFMVVPKYDSMIENGFTTEGITVNVYDYNTLELLDSTTIDSSLSCSLVNIPYGDYYIYFKDNRVLEQEALRLNTYGIHLIVAASGSLEIGLYNKYTEGILTLGYGSASDNVEIPLANTEIVIRKPDGTLWQKTQTDENGQLTWYVTIGDTYCVYADGELFLEIVA